MVSLEDFEMSIIEDLNHLLGLQIKQLKEVIFINQSKYINDILKKYRMESAKSIPTPMSIMTDF